MKTLSYLGCLLLSLGLLSSCGGGGTEQSQSAVDTVTKAPAKPARPPYDATKIDAKAPVQKIALDATGKSMTDMHYSDTVLHFKSGSTIKISFHNKGEGDAMKHNFVLVYKGTMESVATAGITAGMANNYVKPGSEDVLVAAKVLNAGEKEEITFPAPPAGEYEFVCTYPGHWMMMHGKVIVE